MARSAEGTRVSVSVALLLPEFGSDVGEDTVAVLETVPVADPEMVPVTV